MRSVFVQHGKNGIDTALSKGSSSFLIFNDPDVSKTLRSCDVAVSAIVPDVTRYVRDMTKYGLIGMGLRKLKSLGLVNLFRLAPTVLKSALGILGKNFKVLLPILVLVDYLELKKLKPRYLFLHFQMTDLALANDNKALIEKYLKMDKGVKLGLMTKNLGLLEKKLDEWGLDVEYVLAPFNSKGFMMRGSKEECEGFVKKGKRKYLSFGSVGLSDLEKEEKYLDSVGLEEAFLTVKT